MKPRAFILTGYLPLVCRDSVYLDELRCRELKVLVLTPAISRSYAQAHGSDPAHPASAIDEIAFVDGSVASEGSYLPGVIEHAERWRQSYDIVGIYAVGETLVEPTGLVADYFGLPFPGLRAARACRNKYLQRWYLPDLSPVSVLIPPGSRESVGSVPFPAVVKPATRHSSEGVQMVHDRAELAAQLNEYPTQETILVEQMIRGQEYSVESLTQDGKTLFSSVTRKETTDVDSQYFVEMAHTVPAPRDDKWDAVQRATFAMLDRLGIENGITHAEWRLDERGDARLMEVAARTPGDGIMVLYHLATGRRMEPEILRIALGETADYPAARRFARQVYVAHMPGTLVDVTVDWPGVEPVWVDDGNPWPDLEPLPADHPAALRAVLVYEPRGAALGPIRNSDDRAVTFFIDAPTLAELDEIEARVRAAVEVHTR
ncbi:acetyl-CoA carboxylase biotin carboxylase subunit family protein [Mycolicibacterium sp. P1-5]|uniref:ATP-grasp domain-containing protein n=1 Tax=Mycolicibacterium sp. P1-5 TaxID=2024617 RepID=UPI0011EE615E|nr:ATP-grasp domain-containing protein [Mycolicibacterium sp. P1-5]KAA0110641.1 ATP-grasp domain-containing protein [Mycolicibacterium sp. P1-5]